MKRRSQPKKQQIKQKTYGHKLLNPDTMMYGPQPHRLSHPPIKDHRNILQK